MSDLENIFHCWQQNNLLQQLKAISLEKVTAQYVSLTCTILLNLTPPHTF